MIGLGEPPAIGVFAAIGNAVANAIGVRVPQRALTRGPRAGRPGREERIMQAFEYANPLRVHEARGHAGRALGRSGRAGRRHGPAQPDEGAYRVRRSGW